MVRGPHPPLPRRAGWARARLLAWPRPSPVRRTAGFGLDNLVEIRGERCRALGAVPDWTGPAAPGAAPDRLRGAGHYLTLQSAVVLLAGYTPPAQPPRDRRDRSNRRGAARPCAEHARRCAVGRPVRRPGHRLLQPARSPLTASRWTSGWSAMSSTSVRPVVAASHGCDDGHLPGVERRQRALRRLVRASSPTSTEPACPSTRPWTPRPWVPRRPRSGGRAVCQTVGLSRRGKSGGSPGQSRY